jgi:hypothetical protein
MSNGDANTPVPYVFDAPPGYTLVVGDTTYEAGATVELSPYQAACSDWLVPADQHAAAQEPVESVPNPGEAAPHEHDWSAEESGGPSEAEPEAEEEAEPPEPEEEEAEEPEGEASAALRPKSRSTTRRRTTR